MFFIPLGGDDYITSKLQERLDKTKRVIADICELSNIQEKLVLLLQCIPGRIQHLLAAVPMNLSRGFAKQHDEALFSAVAATLKLGQLSNWGNSLKETDCSCREKYLIMDLACVAWRRIWNSFFLLASCGQLRRSSTRFPTLTAPYSTRYKEILVSDANLLMRCLPYTDYQARNYKSCFLTPSQRYS